jgi:hypothetical protein
VIGVVPGSGEEWPAPPPGWDSDVVVLRPEDRRARITWAEDIDPEPVVWAWGDGDEGRIPAGSLSVAAGREGTGKSSFGIWLAAQVTRGALPGSFHGTPRSVFYLAIEDSWKYTLVPRLIAAKADRRLVGRFEVITMQDDAVTLSLPSDNALLEAAIKEHAAALVVIDPLMSVIGEGIDTHRAREVRSALDPLAQLADRSGAVILGIAHFNKGNGTDAASLITGSGAFKDVPRSVFGFARDTTDEASGARVFTQVKNSLGRDDLPSLAYRIETAEVPTRKGVARTGRLVFLGESDRSVHELLRDSRLGEDDHSDRQEAADWLVDYLTGRQGEAPTEDVFKAGRAAGFAQHVLKRAKKKIDAKSARIGFGSEGIWVWRLDVSAAIGSAIGSIGSGLPNPAPLAPYALPMAAPGPGSDDEGSTKGAKGAGHRTLRSSLPSVLPSDGCDVCGEPVAPEIRTAGLSRHPSCPDLEEPVR